MWLTLEYLDINSRILCSQFTDDWKTGTIFFFPNTQQEFKLLKTNYGTKNPMVQNSSVLRSNSTKCTV